MLFSDAPTGRGVRVAVVDSGIHASHPHVGGIAGGIALHDHGTSNEIIDQLGHGTAVAAAIREKAPDVELLAVRVFWRTLTTDAATLVRAIDWAADHGARIINLSLGTRDERHRNHLEAAIARASRRGAFVVSAGADAEGDWYPGALDGVIGVQLDWTCDRHTYGIVASSGRLVIAASGYPREIPGIPRERNLKGISFAVANGSGFVARALERDPPPTVDALLQQLRSNAYNRPHEAATQR
jgi:subtilisin family serine protease